ncbi:NPC intracellular cholesterol transporter 1 homolog 1-like [Sitodiplosis mosellana]|uniref:NPC intracellular cholesterol transporter 1 homolog 1-like n=1 Tax=Sitodiplosis mosellana TaxID=263140 RepID=UPI0024437835|nr:NPC intracellular cholesterol transporter 1 homolog 1-like [Sitodiplosis mosellana]
MNDDIKWLKRFLSSSNCPGCFENFARPICEMTCSPKQSQFLKVQKVEAADADYRPYVKSMDYSIAHQHLKATFTSCKMVTFLFRPVLNYMCGDAKGEDCTLDKWRNYLIEFSKEYHPFQINYITEPIKNYTSINVPCS